MKEIVIKKAESAEQITINKSNRVHDIVFILRRTAFALLFTFSCNYSYLCFISILLVQISSAAVLVTTTKQRKFELVKNVLLTLMQSALVVIISILFNWFTRPNYKRATLCGWICIAFIGLYTFASVSIFAIDLYRKYKEAKHLRRTRKYNKDSTTRAPLRVSTSRIISTSYTSRNSYRFSERIKVKPSRTLRLSFKHQI